MVITSNGFDMISLTWVSDLARPRARLAEAQSDFCTKSMLSSAAVMGSGSA
jgi:hypothetical protein